VIFGQEAKSVKLAAHERAYLYSFLRSVCPGQICPSVGVRARRKLPLAMARARRSRCWEDGCGCGAATVVAARACAEGPSRVSKGRRGGAATTYDRDDGASMPCARLGGAKLICVCDSACVGDKVKVERERIIKNEKKEEKRKKDILDLSLFLTRRKICFTKRFLKYCAYM